MELDVIEQEVNAWLKEADKMGHIVDDIQFRDDPGDESQNIRASTTVMVRYRE